ncbi:aldehyde dehydrogenase family protein [Hirsutella rhossiliensis]|uniref:Aldehyde dehydrogenase family domain-containing protein n=1 Tax=Hirsutella rhossiliensis TaxID=111463 RepID=A0A9P8N5E2_9HYPO|nr:aldehyde dehydrogenase family domain-containing protein [Hirsutella rhossiliensis]KAH0966074.1 aldehyde dehydrogenase family domain-containing protein [Hirsutella rhossiliensis]
MATQSPPPLTVPSWIDGAEKTHETTFAVIAPSTSNVCWNAASASPADALLAVEAAAAALPAWKASKPMRRRAILLRAAALMEERADELSGYMSTEMGADAAFARHLVLELAIAMLRDCAARAPTVCGSVQAVETEGQSAMVWKEPYGVVLGIVPWNAPYVFGVRAAATAMATGNTTVLKASEMTPRCYWALGKILHDAGAPAGVVNIISSCPSDAPDLARAMVEHPAVKKINFTGSATVGRKVARLCSDNLKPVLLELGGKNSAIILPDADLEKAARACIVGGFANAGQICMSTDRLIIHADIAPEFLQVLKKSLAAAQAASPSLPLVASAASAARLGSVVADAQARGAHVFSGGPNPPGKAAHFAPTVLGGLSSDMDASREENFGPLMGYVTVTSEEEAVEVTNGSGYGLSASVFTRDLRKGFALAKKLECGAVHINSMTVQDEVALPFGGVNRSGWGRFNAAEGMEEFLVTKCVTWDD